MSSYLTRYRSGERCQVWSELVNLGASVYDASHHEPACAVAEETMRIVRDNLRRIHARLLELKYEFYDPILKTPIPATDVIRDSTPETINAVVALEERVGRLPISLRYWFTIVGSVNFMGRFPDQQFKFTNVYWNPIVVAGAEDLLQELEFDEKNRDRADVFQGTLAPDKFLKAGESGGACFVELPCKSMDFIFRCDNDLMFVSYLRNALAWGGFPGLQQISSSTDRLVSELTKDLKLL